MQTVNFQCGHCGKLMAVSVDFLGQQVRCPHCQQVVLAPAASVSTAPAPAPAPFVVQEQAPAPGVPEDPFRTLTVQQPAPPEEPFPSLSVNANEDIFTTRKEPEDALFGQADVPHLEIPRDIVPSSPSHALDMPLETTLPSPPPAPEVTLPTVSMSPPAINEFGEGPRSGVNEPDTVLWPTSLTSEAPSSPLEGPSADMGAMASPSIRKLRDQSDRINWFIPLVFIPLILYAVLATAMIGFLYMRIQARPPSIWEQFPDVEGDTPGVRPKKGGVSLNFDRSEATKLLPENLRVKLGETLRLGDLEVTPLKVQRQRVKILTEGFDQAEPLPHDSLVLTLKFHNRAQECSFTPLDNYFDRHYDGRQSSVPLTLLVAGTVKFYGGPAKWYPLDQNARNRERREWLDLPGRKNVDRKGLAPGESMEACICTDGADPAVVAHLFGINQDGKRVSNAWSGKLLWRVQVRRGRIEYKGKNRSAAAVIGVEFTPRDYGN
jgi:hypothetical protein